MNVFGIAIIGVIAFFAVLGGVIGAVKGFTRVKSWGVEFVLTGIFAIFISGFIAGKLLKSSTVAAGFVSIGIAVIFTALFAFLFWPFRKLLTKRIEKRKQMSYYSNYMENEQNTVKILGALASNDMREYKKLTKRKVKHSGGAWSALDRVFGALTVAISGIVIAGIIAAACLTLLDFTLLAHEGGKLYATFGKLYEGASWAFFKKHLMDFAVIGIITVSIKTGFSNGISSTLWTFFVLFLVFGAGVLSVYFAFRVDAFVNAAKALDAHLADKLSGVSSMLSQVKLTTLFISQIIIAAGVFLLMLVAIILIGVFVPKFIDNARNGKLFSSIDGVFGAIFMLLIICGVIMAVGAVLNSIHDVAFMSVFNAYFEKSNVATFFYDNNLLNVMGILKLSIAQYLQ